MSTATAAVRTVTLEIDGIPVTAPEGTTIYAAAKAAGVDIPVLCHNERYDPVGVCRMCVVDTGGRAFAASCVRPCEAGMKVTTTSPELERARATLTELLISDQPPAAEDPKQTTTGDNLLLGLADRFEVSRDTTDLPCGSGRGTDGSNPVINVNHDACILCDRCVRACDDIQGNDVIGRSGKGYRTRIAFDFNDTHGVEFVRHLRRVRPGVPHRCPDQQAHQQRADPPPGRTRRRGERLPVLRGGLRPHLLRGPGAGGHSLCRRPGSTGVPEPAMREGPLRLGLRGVTAAADRAADPDRRRLSEGAVVRRRPGRRPGGWRRPSRPSGRPRAVAAVGMAARARTGAANRAVW